jgi:hypothetical protein
MRKAMQNAITCKQMYVDLEGACEPQLVALLLRQIKAGPLRNRNKAVAVLARKKGYSAEIVSRFLWVNQDTVVKWLKTFKRRWRRAVTRHEIKRCKEGGTKRIQGCRLFDTSRPTVELRDQPHSVANKGYNAAGLQSGQPLFQSVNSVGTEVTGRALNRYNAWAAIRKAG